MNKLDQLEKNELHQKRGASSENRFLQFSLGKEAYAMPLLKVREVIAKPDTTPIPNTPKYFLGIMNLRGQVISIVDLRTKLGIKPTDENSEEAVIIVDLNPIYLGVVVDSVNRVLVIDESSMSEPPDVVGGSSVDYLQGVYRGESGMTLVIDIGRVLNFQDLKHLEKNASASKSAA